MSDIFFITNELYGGGAERVMSVLANYLDDKGHNVSFIVLQKKGKEYELHPSIKKYYRTDIHRGDVLAQIGFIRNVMKKHKNASFVSFFTYQNIYTILASIGLSVRVVVSERNDPSKTVQNWLDSFVRRILYSSHLCDEVVFQTKGAMEYFGSKIIRKSLVIPNPIKDELPLPYEGVRSKRVVSFGRLEPQKNYQLLIRAFSNIAQKYPDYRLELYGKGSLENELVELAKSLNIDDKVIFKGFSDSVHEDILDASVFVLPSDYEGLSNSMLEALAIGLPCICTDCPPGGAREYIQNYINGILVPVGDVEMLSDALVYMLKNLDKSRCMGLDASKIRNQLNTVTVSEKWERAIFDC